YGFTNMLLKLMNGLDADDTIAVIFDAARKSFRHEFYADYKGHRPDVPPDLIPQFPLVRQAAEAFHLHAIEMANYEADDIIASYAIEAQKQGKKVRIISGDKDLMQLVGQGIELFDPIKNKPINENEVKEKFGVTPDKVIDVQALAGDSSDNVPGVPGIGVKTAAELINLYGSLENLLAKAPEIKQPKRREALINHAEDARISKRLVTLKCDVPLPIPINELKAPPLDKGELIKFVSAQGFKTLAARLQNGQKNGDEAKASLPQEATKSPALDFPPPAIFKRGAYHIVNTEKDLDSWIEKIREAGLVSVDVETDSLHPVSANLVGISLCVKAGEAAYIPLQHRKPPGDLLGAPQQLPPQLNLKKTLAALKEVLENPAILKIGHNLKFDYQVFAQHEIYLSPIDDTMVMSYVLDGAKHGHGMDELAMLHLGYQTITYDEVTGTGRARVNFAEVAVDKAAEYAAEDADVTLALYHYLKPRLAAEKMVSLYETIERPLISVLAELESAGVLIDPETLGKLSSEFATKLDQLAKEIYQEAGMEFNLASPKQLGEVLFDKLKLPNPTKTKTGQYSTDARTLEELAEAGHTLPEKILEWRQLAKLKSTYTDALPEQINPKTGRVHTSFAMTVTNTGRLSSTDPNLQNIPIKTNEGRSIRTAFIAPPGKILLSADYSQIELRLLAEFAGVKTLQEAFHQGIDIHALTASQVFGMKLEEVTPEARRHAKTINFGIIYGMSAFGLAKQINSSNAEAKEFIDTYFKQYPGIRAYMESSRAYARQHGYVKTLFGRKCFIPEIQASHAGRRQMGERQASNAPLQGTAADIIKRAMVKINPALAAAKLGAQQLLQVHDELVFETPKEEVEETSALIKQVMEGAHEPAVTLNVPLVVDIGVGENWEKTG
ncbi:MAG: DNA polymerase I, partial [Dongiaceae bacterium]